MWSNTSDAHHTVMIYHVDIDYFVAARRVDKSRYVDAAPATHMRTNEPRTSLSLNRFDYIRFVCDINDFYVQVTIIVCMNKNIALPVP